MAATKQADRSPRLNAKQREAMLMLQDMRRRYPGEHCDGTACSDSTWFALGTTWPAYINYRTAGALQRRGLVTTEYIGPDEGSDITLTDTGVEWSVTR